LNETRRAQWNEHVWTWFKSSPSHFFCIQLLSDAFHRVALSAGR
jgi:hypothetical protein